MINAKGFSCSESVLIRSQELEFPFVRGLLVFNAIFDILRRIFPARVLQTVRDDDAEDVFRAFGFRHLGELVTYGVDGRADSIVQCRTAGAVILGHEVIVEEREIDGLDRPFYHIVELEQIEMKVQSRITPAVITAATSLLQPYCPDLNPRNLSAALKAWEAEPQKTETPIIEKPLTRFEVAELLGVSLPTVNRMMNDGRLQKIKLTPHGSARITPASVRTILYGPQTQEQPSASAEVF